MKNDRQIYHDDFRNEQEENGNIKPKLRRIPRNDAQSKRRRRKIIRGKQRWKYVTNKWPYNLKWLRKYKKIRERMDNDRDMSFHSMMSILQYLRENTLSIMKSSILAEKIGAGTFEDKGRTWTYVMCGPIDRDQLSSLVMGGGKEATRLYLKALERNGLVKRFKRKGRNGLANYAIGYYSITRDPKTHETKYVRANYFLQNNMMCREILENLSMREKKNDK